MLHFLKLISPILSTTRLPTHSLSPLFSLHRLLTTAAPAPIPPKPFAVDDYLITTCGLTRAQACKASKKLSNLTCPSRPNAVLAYLSSLGVSRSGAAAAVVADPRILSSDVENILAVRVAELTDLGLERSQIARLIPHSRSFFRHSSLLRNLDFWLPVFGSFARLFRAIKLNGAILRADVETVAKPNVAFLQQCGIIAGQFHTTYITRVLTRHPEHVMNAVAHIDKLGVPRDSPMFRYALVTFAVHSQKRIAKKIENLEMLGWSKDDVSVAVRKLPGILAMSEERLQRNVGFLTSDVGLEIPYIARRPALVLYSYDRRLLPRHSLLKVLKARGLLHAEHDFYSVVVLTEKKFLDKFVHPYEKSFPGLAMIYTSTCAGKVPNGVSCLWWEHTNMVAVLEQHFKLVT